MTVRQTHILVVDDDREIREALGKVLRKMGFEVDLCVDGHDALARFQAGSFPLVLLDLKMPGLGGLEVLREIKRQFPQTEVVILTGHGTIEQAVEAMKEGAYDFITKPVSRVNIERIVARALEHHNLLDENRALREQLKGMREEGKVIGSSPAMRRTLDLVAQVSPSSATILILGESGTGKEVIAEAIHSLSPRANKPLLKVNCAALPETLLESELFGYEKGAFTGALSRKEGRFEIAHGGTLFLDEIGDLSPTTQVKLLRVLQEGEFERVGGTRTIKVDVRLVTATHRDLLQAVQEGKFREDLYYRINVITIPIPPLRERRKDIPLLAHHFLEMYNRRNGKALSGFTLEAMKALSRHHWPGNVRELENIVERAVILSRHSIIGMEDLPREIGGKEESFLEQSLTVPIGVPLQEVERRLIEETLRRTKGDKTLAARLLGIASRTIYRKLEGKDQESD